MTSKREKILWTVYALVLVLLFLISSTDLIIKEEKQEVYPISVVIGDTTDDFYVNFKKGVDQASSDYHADVSFLTLYERDNAAQQIERVVREMNDGARGVILCPADDEAVKQALDENLIRGPLVVVNSEMSHSRIAVTISEDHYEAGKLLAEHAAAGVPPDIPVYLISAGFKNGADALAGEGAMSVLLEAGYQVEQVEVKSEEDARSLVEGMVHPTGPAVFLALDMESMINMANLLDENPGYRQAIAGFYGLGSNLAVLNYLDSGVIDGIVAANDFIKGYLSIQKAVEAIQNSRFHETVKAEHFYIEKEDLRKKEYQKLLYPID